MIDYTVSVYLLIFYRFMSIAINTPMHSFGCTFASVLLGYIPQNKIAGLAEHVNIQT